MPAECAVGHGKYDRAGAVPVARLRHRLLQHGANHSSSAAQAIASATNAARHSADGLDPVSHSTPALLRLPIRLRPSPNKTEEPLRGRKKAFLI
jgi:hypothetical protein